MPLKTGTIWHGRHTNSDMTTVWIIYFRKTKSLGVPELYKIYIQYLKAHLHEMSIGDTWATVCLHSTYFQSSLDHQLKKKIK